MMLSTTYCPVYYKIWLHDYVAFILHININLLIRLMRIFKNEYMAVHSIITFFKVNSIRTQNTMKNLFGGLIYSNIDAFLLIIYGAIHLLWGKLNSA